VAADRPQRADSSVGWEPDI